MSIYETLDDGDAKIIPPLMVLASDYEALQAQTEIIRGQLRIAEAGEQIEREKRETLESEKDALAARVAELEADRNALAFGVAALEKTVKWLWGSIHTNVKDSGRVNRAEDRATVYKRELATLRGQIAREIDMLDQYQTSTTEGFLHRLRALATPAMESSGG